MKKYSVHVHVFHMHKEPKSNVSLCFFFWGGGEALQMLRDTNYKTFSIYFKFSWKCYLCLVLDDCFGVKQGCFVQFDIALSMVFRRNDNLFTTRDYIGNSTLLTCTCTCRVILPVIISQMVLTFWLVLTCDLLEDSFIDVKVYATNIFLLFWF